MRAARAPQRSRSGGLLQKPLHAADTIAFVRGPAATEGAGVFGTHILLTLVPTLVSLGAARWPSRSAARYSAHFSSASRFASGASCRLDSCRNADLADVSSAHVLRTDRPLPQRWGSLRDLRDRSLIGWPAPITVWHLITRHTCELERIRLRTRNSGSIWHAGLRPRRAVRLCVATAPRAQPTGRYRLCKSSDDIRRLRMSRWTVNMVPALTRTTLALDIRCRPRFMEEGPCSF